MDFKISILFLPCFCWSCFGLLQGINTPTTEQLLNLINQLNQTLQSQNIKNAAQDTKIAAQTAEIAKQTAEIAALKSDHSSSQIAFLALLTHFKDLGTDQAIEFDHVITNDGHAYDARHGHFVAPVKGIYLFSVTVMSKDVTSALHVQMVKNGVSIANLYSDTNGLDNAASTAFVDMNPGDMVWVKHMSGSITEGIYTGEYCSFGGALINKM